MHNQCLITIYIAYAETATQHHYFSLQITENICVADILLHQQMKNLMPNTENVGFGIFGKKITLDYQLQDGDRLEIYRPLARDPMKKRRLNFAAKKNMSN